MKLLIDDEKLKAWAEAIREYLDIPKELNNPGGLLWRRQLGATPATPPVAGQPRPMARFETWEMGEGALYRELAGIINGEEVMDEQYNKALATVLQGQPPHAFPQYFLREV